MNCCKLVQIVSKEADTPFPCPSGQVQLEDMITLGCKRQQTAALALQIYIELCEDYVIYFFVLQYKLCGMLNIFTVKS
ncbi:unnamed protein product [Timema podura]|uniref:Uncharacterized protein n=1 Tax=Timema podura TaxID=61482 RepID=A0ABN7PAZ1_TIMPD|nr:unnamed protein product [Timema podura]